MSLTFRSFSDGIRLEPNSSSAPSRLGEIRYNSSTNRLEYYNSSVTELVDVSASQTLSNKTLSTTLIDSLIRYNVQNVSIDGFTPTQPFIRLDTITVLTSIVAGSAGQKITLTNISSDRISIQNNSSIITGIDGDISLAAGASLDLIYDNTDTAWRVVGGAGSDNNNINTQNSNYTVLSSDSYIRADSFSSDITYTLPPVIIGKKYTFKKCTDNIYKIIITANGTDKIDDSSSQTLLYLNETLIIIGAISGKWEII